MTNDLRMTCEPEIQERNNTTTAKVTFATTLTGLRDS